MPPAFAKSTEKTGYEPPFVDPTGAIRPNLTADEGIDKDIVAGLAEEVVTGRKYDAAVGAAEEDITANAMDDELVVTGGLGAIGGRAWARLAVAEEASTVLDSGFPAAKLAEPTNERVTTAVVADVAGVVVVVVGPESELKPEPGEVEAGAGLGLESVMRGSAQSPYCPE
ncbi:hypothetical protein FRC07_000569 [Ceratobasidium sp. 392]|nr:hypothetical protein FRC07_000569 [Ceratobasidium sp. 392]